MKLLSIGLIISLLVDYSLANCIVKGYEDTTTINIDKGVNEDAETFISISTENVESVKMDNEVTYPYVKVEYADNILHFSPTDAFANFEENTDNVPPPGAKVSTVFTLTCSDGTKLSMNFHQLINDVNNYKPEFDQPSYRITLPMPFPSGISITEFTGLDIIVTDIDVTNEGIDFEVTDGTGLTVEYGGKVDNSKGKKHRGILRTNEFLQLTETTTYTVQATDKGNPTKSSTAEIVIEIDENGSLPTNPQFDEEYYLTTYNAESETHTIDPVLISLNTKIEDVTLSGTYAKYFNFDITDDYKIEISVKENLPTDVIDKESFIPLGISVKLRDSEITARTSVIVSMPTKVVVQFDEPLYKAVYNTETDKHNIGEVKIGVNSGADVKLLGDFADYFLFDEVKQIITLGENIPEDKIASLNYLDVIIEATLGTSSSKSVLIVSLPETPIFTKTLYEATYNKDNPDHSIGEVAIQVVNEADVTLEGDYFEYFHYNENTKTITLNKNIPDDVIASLPYVDVTIKATLGSRTSEAVLVVLLPEQQITEIFSNIFYEATYNKDNTDHSIGEVAIQVVNEAEVTLEGDYFEYFHYNENTKTITLNKNIPDEVITSLPYVDVTIKATLESRTSEAVLVVLLPEQQITEIFSNIFYEATYNKDNADHSIGEVAIQVVNEADVTLEGDYFEYFYYNENTKTITLNKNIPDEVITSLPYVDVTIKATLGSRTSKAVLVVLLPEQQITEIFSNIFYEATYNKDNADHSIGEVAIQVVNEAEVTLEGDYFEYFDYNENTKTITLNKNIPDDVIASLPYVDVTIKATLGSRTSEAVLVVLLPEQQITEIFSNIFYEATYNKDNTDHSIGEVAIQVVNEAEVTLEGDYFEYFDYNENTKTITLNKNIPDDVIASLPYVDVTIKATLGSRTSEAVLVVLLPEQQITEIFSNIFYEAIYNKDNTDHSIGEITIQVINEADVTLEGDYFEYFHYNENTKTITLNKNIPDEVIASLPYVDVTIKATLGSRTSEAVLVVLLPEQQITEIFSNIFYEATYNKDNTDHSIGEIAIQVINEAVVTLEGDYFEYFDYNKNTKTITLNKNIPDEVITSLPYVDVTIKATLGSRTSEAVLVVLLPEQQITEIFSNIFYEATYNKDNTDHSIGEIAIQVINEADVTLEGDYFEYFDYNENTKTITLKKNIPDEVITSLPYVDVTIKATLGSRTSEAVLVVLLPLQQITEIFSNTFYEATYSKDNVDHSIGEVAIQVINEADVTLEGDYFEYFDYNENTKIIILKKNIPDEKIASLPYVDVTIKATLGSRTSEAVLVVSLPHQINDAFSKIFYEATYNKDNVDHSIGEVLIQVVPEALVSLQGDYASYFDYKEDTKTIILKKNIPDNEIALLSYVDVTIQATIGSTISEAVLVVSLPHQINDAFTKIFYEATYNKDNVDHSIGEVLIQVVPEALVSLQGDYASYFDYKEDTKSIVLKKNIPDNEIALLSYVDITIQATIGSTISEAVLVVSLPHQINDAFSKIFYEATYNKDNVDHSIGEVLIQVVPEALVSLQGDYANYFDYKKDTKSIILKKNIPDNEIALLHYVDVTIQATIGSTISEAVLVVSLPHQINDAFSKIFYEATYNKDNVDHSIGEVLIQVVPEALVSLQGDYASYFDYKEDTKSIILKKNIPDNEIALLSYVDVTIQATIGSTISEAVLVVSLPHQINDAFTKIFYEATYNKDNVDHSIGEVLIQVVPEALVSLQGDYASYFDYKEDTKSIVLKKNIPDNEIALLSYVDITIQATIGSTISEAVLVVSLPHQINDAFSKIFYEATYNKDNVDHSIGEVLIQVVPEALVSLQGDYANYFDYKKDTKSIILKKNIPDNEIALLHYVDVTIQATIGSTISEAVLVVSLPHQINDAFSKIFYEATYNKDNVDHSIGEVLIQVVPEALVSLQGDYANYFDYKEDTKSIILKKNIPDNEIALLSYVDITIQATIGSTISEAVLVVSLPHEINDAFSKIFYEATYNKDNVDHSIGEVLIQVVPEALVSLQGDYASYFDYKEDTKSIILKKNIPDNEIALLSYVDVTIQATIGSTISEAVLVVSLPHQINDAFSKIFYEATYNKDNVDHSVGEVLIQVVPEALVSLQGDYASYFDYKKDTKSIILKKNIPDNEIALLSYVDVTIQATIGSTISEAVLVVSLPHQINDAFSKIFYEATYNKDNVDHSIGEVLIQVVPEALVSLQGDYASYFDYKEDTKSIILKKNIPDNEIALLPYVDVTIQATIGSTISEAVLVVSLPHQTNEAFSKIFYEATYNNDEEIHSIDEVIVQVVDEAVVTLDGEYRDYFDYKEETRQIILKNNIPDDKIATLPYVDVTIKATIGSSVSKAILVVALPRQKINVAFSEIFYEASYNNDGDKHSIDEVIIKVVDEADITLDGEYAEYFDYQKETKLIVLEKNLPDDKIATLPYVDVTIKATIESSISEAILVVSLPHQVNEAFSKIFYEATYNNDGDQHSIGNVIIQVMEEADVTLEGEYAIYFKYEEDTKSIVLKDNIPDEIIAPLTYVSVSIKATIGSSISEAVLVVSLPSLPTTTAKITFDEAYVFKIKPSEDINKIIEAKSTIDEQITYELVGNVPQEVQLSQSGQLVVAKLPSGFYTFEIKATGSLSKATGFAPLIISVESGELCNDEIKAAYSFLAKSIDEEQNKEYVILEKHDKYKYVIESIKPETDKFALNSNDDFVAKTLDRESSDFTNGKPQYTVTLELVPRTGRQYSRMARSTYPRSLVNKQLENSMFDAASDQCYLMSDIENFSNKIVIGVNVKDINDHKPEFKVSEMIIGYPESELLSTVSPSHLLKVEATDEDTGDYASLKYTVDDNKVVIDQITGYIYPTDKIYDIESFKVTATDDNGNGLKSDPLTVKVKFLEFKHLSVLLYQNKHLEDIEDIISRLSKYADVRYLSASVIPGTSQYQRAENPNERTLSIIAYAFDLEDQELLSSEELKEKLDDVEGLTIESLPTSGGGTDLDDTSSDTGLIVAVSVLAVLLVLLLIGFIAFYFLKFRKSKKYDKMEDGELSSKPNPLETPKFAKKSGSIASSKPEVDINTRRPTGYVYPTDLFEESSAPTDSAPPAEALNGDMKERRKSVVFNSNVEEINIEREADDQKENPGGSTNGITQKF